MSTRPVRVCACGVAALLSVLSAKAQDLWLGTTDALWDTNTNWTLGQKPGALDPVLFPLSVPLTGPVITLGAGEVANDLSFQNNYSLLGGDLTLITGAISVDPATTATIGSALNGTAITKTGNGTLILGGVNGYTGLTTVSAGVLNIQSNGALGTVGAGTTVAANAALELQGGIVVGAEALTLNGLGSGPGTTGALRNVSGNNTWGGNITLASAASIISDSGTLTVDVASGNAIAGALALTIGGAGDITVADVIATGVGTITKEGAGTLRINADPSTTGQMTINGGVVELNHTGTIDFNTVINSGGTMRTLQADIGDTVDIAVNAGGFLDIRSGNDTMGGLSGAGTVTRGVTGAAVLTVNNGAENTTFSGVIENGAAGGTLGITKASTGTLTLTGANTFTGPLLINNSAVGVQGLIVSGPSGSLATLNVNVGDNNGGNESMTVGAAGDLWITGALNRLTDAATVMLSGSTVGGFTYVGPATGSSDNVEVIGSISVTNGRNNFTLVPGTGNEVQVTTGTLAFSNGASLLIRGANLGGTGPGSTRLVIASPTLAGAGGADGTTTKSIIAAAIGGNSTTDAGSDFLTYDPANGVRTLTAAEYDSAIAGTTALRNVKVGAAGETVAANQSINSLLLNGAGTVTINSGATVKVNSGAILIVGNGTALAGTIGGAGTLDFGSTLGMIHLAQNTTAATAAINARMSGTAGFSFGRSGDGTNVLQLGGDNTVIGNLNNNMGTLQLMNPGAANDNYPMTYLGHPATNLQIMGNNIVLRDLQSGGGTSTFQNGAATNAVLTTYLTAVRTVATVISNGSTGTLGLTVSGGQTLTLSATNTYTGPTEVRTGTLVLSGNATGTAANSSSVLVSGAGNLRLTNTNGNTSGDRIGSVPITLSSGQIDFDNNAGAATNFSETLGALTLRPGSNFIFVDKAASGQTSVLTFTSLAQRDPGALLVARSQNNNTEIFDLGQTTQSRLVFTPGFTLDDGIIGSWFVVQTSATSREFAKYVPSGTISVTALQAADYTATLNSGANPTQNVRIATTPAALTSDTQVNTLTLNQTAATTVDIGVGNTLRIESGGLAVNNNFNANFINGTITAGTGPNAAAELIIHVVSATTNPLVIDSVIADNGTGSVTLVKGSAGVLDLQGVTNTYTGKTYVSGGTLRIDADANLGTAPATPTVGALSTGANAIVEVTNTMTLNANRGIALGGGTTTFSITAGAAGAGKTLTYNGAITTVAGANEAGVTFQSNAVITTLPDPGKFNATLTAPINIGGPFRLDAGTVTTGVGTNVIGRSFQLATNGVASFIQTSGTLKIGAGINDTFDVGVSNVDSLNKVGTLNLAGVSNLTVNVDLVRVGVVTGGGTSAAQGIITFATSNDITAGTSILVGDSAQAGLSTSTLTFGSGVNNIMTQTFTLGGRKGPATLNLNAGGTLNLMGFGQRTLNMFIGRQNFGTAGLNTSTLNAGSGTVNGSFNTLSIGEKSVNLAGGSDSTFTIGSSAASTLEAESVILGTMSGASGTAVASSRAFGTLNMAGGTFTVFGDVAMGTFAGTLGTARGVLNLTGGTFTVGGNITQTSAVNGHGGALITVNGATAVLDLRNDAAGDLTTGNITASQLTFRAGSIVDVNSATFTGNGVTDGVTFAPLADALIVRDMAINFPVNLTNLTANQGGIHYEAAGGGAGATIVGDVDLGFVGRTFNVENSAGAPADLTITGAVTGFVPLTKTGAGTLLLNNNVTGSVLVSAGVLGGTGTISDTVTVASGATIAPGASIGTLTMGSLTLNNGASFALEISTTASTNDVAAVFGDLTLALSSTVTLSIADVAPAAISTGIFPFITYTGTWNGGLFTVGGNVIQDDTGLISVGGNSFHIDYNYNGSSVALIAVPEPSVGLALLGGLGVLGMMGRRRRR